MKRVGIAAALLFAQSAVASDCPITPSPEGFLCNHSLCAGVPSDGTIVFHPEGPGFVDHDGALGIKFG